MLLNLLFTLRVALLIILDMVLIFQKVIYALPTLLLFIIILRFTMSKTKRKKKIEYFYQKSSCEFDVLFLDEVPLTENQQLGIGTFTYIVYN